MGCPVLQIRSAGLAMINKGGESKESVSDVTSCCKEIWCERDEMALGLFTMCWGKTTTLSHLHHP